MKFGPVILNFFLLFIECFLQQLQRQWTMLTGSWVVLDHDINTDKIWKNTAVQSFIIIIIIIIIII